MRRRMRALLPVALIAATLWPALAHAQAPQDAFADAVRLIGAGTAAASNVGATKEPSEPDHAGDPGGASIWFGYVAPGDGTVALDTAGSDFDTLLGVYSGSTVASLGLVAESDDVPGFITSRAGFPVIEGSTYWIAVDGKSGATGNVLLTLETTLPTCHVIGTAGADQLTGSAGDESICGLSGNDVLEGGEGNDILRAGAGDDRLVAGPGDDELLGDVGGDVVDFSAAVSAARIDIDRGVATSVGLGRDDLDGIEDAIGSAKGDRIIGDQRANDLDGRGGGDRIDGGPGADALRGGDGADRLSPGGGNDQVSGGKGIDVVSFASSSRAASVDLAFGRARGDGLDALASLEGIDGSSRNDTLRGNKAANRISGGGGNDLLSGLGGNDRLSGGSGADRIFAGSGRDRISGGAGSDTCYPRACERRAAFDDWLPVVNRFRSISHLPRVMENPAFSAGDVKHARYVVKTDVGGHYEDPKSPWYTQDGALAGANSNVYWSSSPSVSDRSAISYWMTGPFHAIGLLRPGLAEVGYGAYREASSPGIRMAAALNVLAGLEALSSQTEYPIAFPGRNARTSLTTYSGNEHPDPLTGCSGYRAPTGLPILLTLEDEPNVSAHSFKRGGNSLAHCVYDGTDYQNPSNADQSLGRAVLGNTVVLIPRQPLVRAARYTVTIRSRGTTHEWSFTVSG